MEARKRERGLFLSTCSTQEKKGVLSDGAKNSLSFFFFFVRSSLHFLPARGAERAVPACRTTTGAAAALEGQATATRKHTRPCSTSRRGSSSSRTNLPPLLLP